MSVTTRCPRCRRTATVGTHEDAYTWAEEHEAYCPPGPPIPRDPDTPVPPPRDREYR